MADPDDPRKWRLDVPQDRIDLYHELSEQPRSLSADEAAKKVELVNAWRKQEHRKHIALMHALDLDARERQRRVAALRRPR